jgi:hypothetical protein
MSVQDTQTDTVLIGGDHGNRVDIGWLHFGFLDPDGISGSEANESATPRSSIGGLSLLSIRTTW